MQLPFENIPRLRLSLWLVWAAICFNVQPHLRDIFFNTSHSQSRRWPRGACAGPSAGAPPAGSRRRETSPEAAAAACAGSRRTFHRRRGCRTAADAQGRVQTPLVRNHAKRLSKDKCSFIKKLKFHEGYEVASLSRV